MEKDTVYLISDAHFGIDLQGCEKREAAFFKWLQEISPEMSQLIIVGDLFDFWIEYKSSIRADYFQVLHALKKVSEQGTEIHYLAGNHDFALGSFLEEKIGIVIHHGDYNTEIQGKKVHIYHGDGLIKKDIGYRILKKVLRNPINQKLYKLIHPDLGVALGTLVSGSSRKYLRPLLNESIIREYRQHALDLLKKGNDIVIFGHTHKGELCRFDSGIYCNTGSWLINYNFASMKNGEIRLWRYREGLSPGEIYCSDLKNGSNES